MKITILTDNRNSWVIPYVEKIKKLQEFKNNCLRHIYDSKDIENGDIMFILSCEKILSPEKLSYHRNNIVVHPSKLPKGKGWSPLTWQILEGKNKIPVSLFEAVKDVDAGEIYLQDQIDLDGTELNEKIKDKQGQIMIKMMIQYLRDYNNLKGFPQKGDSTFYGRRGKEDSELDIEKSLESQFNLLRVVDNERYPAFFYFKAKKFILKIYEEVDVK